MLKKRLLPADPFKEKYKYGLIPVLIVVFVILVAAFLYYDRSNAISSVIQSLGTSGIVLSLILMAIACLTPIPSEGIVVMYLKVYGVYLGTLIAWAGASLSSLVIFVIARYYGQRLMGKFVPAEQFNVVDNWVKRKGTAGLFIARLLPIPAFIVNYIAGVLPSVKLWPYFWTASLSIIPYYIGTALVFLGVSKELWIWLVVGGIAIAAFWGVGYLLNRRPVNIRPY